MNRVALPLKRVTVRAQRVTTSFPARLTEARNASRSRDELSGADAKSGQWLGWSGSRARERGALGVFKFKRLAVKVWPTG
jgi:hypothetical protein